MSDGIEVHFDEKRSKLELACEPGAFATYREIAREQLKNFPGIPLENVIEINIVDTASSVARRAAPKRRIGGMIVGLLIAIVLALAVIGAYAIIAKIAS